MMDNVSANGLNPLKFGGRIQALWYNQWSHSGKVLIP